MLSAQTGHSSFRFYTTIFAFDQRKGTLYSYLSDIRTFEHANSHYNIPKDVSIYSKIVNCKYEPYNIKSEIIVIVMLDDNKILFLENSNEFF